MFAKEIGIQNYSLKLRKFTYTIECIQYYNFFVQILYAILTKQYIPKTNFAAPMT